MDTFDLGLSHFLKDPWVVAKGSAGIKNALLECIFIFNWSGIE
jgi:hypothetical protein